MSALRSDRELQDIEMDMHTRRYDISMAALDELDRAQDKFPSFNSAHEGYAVILEELDELWEEVKKNSKARSVALMRAEAIQVAAMAMRFVLDVCDKEAQP